MNSHIDLMLAESLQARRTTGRNTPLVAVMAGLPPGEHFAQGLVAVSPLDAAPDIPLDLKYAVDKITSYASNIDNWRENQMRIFREALNALGPLNKAYNSFRSQSSKHCSSHVNIAANQLAAFVIGWPDTAITELIRDGANPLGPQQRFGIYRTKHVSPSMSFDDLEESNEGFISALKFRPPLQRTK